MNIAVFPGSFDPVTYVHLDIIERSNKIFEKVVIAVDASTSNPLLSVSERVKLLKHVTKKYSNIYIDSFDGLIIRYVESQKANVIIKNLRAVSDFEREMQMASLNRIQNSNIETFFMKTKEEYTYYSPRNIKELAMYGTSLLEFVPPVVERALRDKSNQIYKLKMKVSS